MFPLENRVPGLRAWRLICITEQVLATFSCDGEWYLQKITDLILQCFSSSSRDQATGRSCCMLDMNMNTAVLWKSLNQIWLGRQKVGLRCATVMFVFLWQPDVYETVSLCLLPERLLLSVQISVSSKKVTFQRLPELKCSWVLLNGRGGDSSWCLCSSGCIVLQDWTWGLMEWAC